MLQLNPFFAWTDVALKTTEMLMSSGQVIHHRVGRMARAGVNPSARDRKEFALMHSEKLKAATDASMAVGLQAWQQWFSACSSMAMPQTSRGYQQAMKRASGNALQLTQAALKPYHGTSRANARRLGRLKP